MPYEPITRTEKQHLGNLMLELRAAMLVGDRAPIVTEMWDRHYHPQPGDWVIETSTITRLVRYPASLSEDEQKVLWDGQFTRFLRTETRIHTYEDTDETWSEQVLICENPDGTEYAWVNAELATVPLDRSLTTGAFA